MPGHDPPKRTQRLLPHLLREIAPEAIRWHVLLRLGTSRLSALTTIHNYWIKRPDGSTAAERFFHMYHADLFESLLDRMDLPVRPSVAPGRAQAA